MNWLQGDALMRLRLFSGPADFESVALSLLLALVLGQLLAWVYRWTHSGLSYSRSFVQSVVLLTMIVALVMVVIGNNIVTAFGLIGALAIIRFRNVLKDTRDTAFVFMCLVVGMGVGSQRYGAAIMGTLVLCTVVLYLHWSRFGSRERHDAMLRFRARATEEIEQLLRRILHRHCRSLRVVSIRRPGPDAPAEFAYEVSLRDRRRNQEMLSELAAVESVRDLSLALQEESQEI